MGVFNNSPRDGPAGQKQKLWNPSDVLGIVNTDPGYQCITCIGYAPSQRRRCRNPIRADNRDLITRTLSEIAYLQPDSPAVASRLRAIAGPALCVRPHENQAGSIIQQWQEKIKQMKPCIEERQYAKPAQNTREHSPIPDQALEDAQEQLREMKRFLAELQEELRKQRQQNQDTVRQETRDSDSRQKELRQRQEREQERQKSEERDREAREKEEERQEKERQEEEERQKKEQEENQRREKEQRAREQAAQNERIRQRAQKVREERERKEREKEQKERQEWDQSWTKYQGGWAAFRASAPRENNIRNAIPWPVKSGSYSDVCASKVDEFMRMAVPRDADTAKMMRKECQKWHPDRVSSWLRGAELTDVDQIMVGMICRVVTNLLSEAAGRSSEFLD